VSICNFTQQWKKPYQKPRYDLADIFRNNISKLSHLTKEQWKVVSAIINCRTSKLGGHLLKCTTCGYSEISYNSCRNRHCPKCQSFKKIQWLEDREKELLPIKYFHIVFTLPSIVNPLVLQNKRIMYQLMFKAAKNTLLEAALNPKNLGATIGIISILHTWGQNLLDHPHIHTIVTGGGLSKNKSQWISARKDFFIAVKKLKMLYRGKFLDYLKRVYNKNQLSFHGSIKKYTAKEEFKQLLYQAYNKEWVVYIKKPFKDSKRVFKYLGRYTHRVALTNSRIIEATEDYVRFSWKDYKDNNKRKIMKLQTMEFLRRFLLHVIPSGFKKIRFYGLFANSCKSKNIENIRRILGVLKKTQEELTPRDLVLKEYGIDISRCPNCKTGVLEIFDLPVESINSEYADTS
jgi:predicted Zn-ribbon and HTH transcriptional regulator